MPPTPKSTTQSRLEQLKAQISGQFNKDKKQFASIFNNVVDCVQGLDKQEIKEIVSDNVLKPALKKLGLQVIREDVPASPAKPKPKPKAKAKRTAKRKSAA